jgi:hypothetical protein
MAVKGVTILDGDARSVLREDILTALKGKFTHVEELT